MARDTGADARSEGHVARRAQLTGDIIDARRRGTSGPRLRPVRGQAQMPEDAFHNARALDQREQPQPAATARAVEHVDPKRPPHELGHATQFLHRRKRASIAKCLTTIDDRAMSSAKSVVLRDAFGGRSDACWWLGPSVRED